MWERWNVIQAGMSYKAERFFQFENYFGHTEYFNQFSKSSNLLIHLFFRIVLIHFITQHSLDPASRGDREASLRFCVK